MDGIDIKMFLTSKQTKDMLLQNIDISISFLLTFSHQ